MSRFSSVVWLLGLISLLADISSELLYPVLPVYLRDAGYSMVALGMLEGISNVIAGLSKGYFGHLSDRTGHRHRFVRWGYGLSSFGKLLLLGSPDLIRVFLSRAVDRLGKGVRSSPRDVLLAAEATPDSSAAVFGFHRAMDTLGAAIGPAIALVWLNVHPGDYTSVFLLAFIPSALSLLVTFFVRDRTSDIPAVSKPATGFFGYFSYWQQSGKEYRRLLRPLILLAIVNSPDAFLLVAVKEAGASDVEMIGVYMVYNLVYALLSTPVGIIADKMGKMKVLIAAIALFSMTYAGMSLHPDLYHCYALFILYAIAVSGMESVVKAIISSRAPSGERGQALGFYASASSIGSLFAGFWAGSLWHFSGASLVFAITAGIASCVALKMMADAMAERRKKLT